MNDNGGHPGWKRWLATGAAWLVLLGMYLLIVGLYGAAAVGAWFHLLSAELRRLLDVVLVRPLQWLRQVHSGYVGDYVVWFMLGSGTVLCVLMLGTHSF